MFQSNSRLLALLKHFFGKSFIFVHILLKMWMAMSELQLLLQRAPQQAANIHFSILYIDNSLFICMCFRNYLDFSNIIPTWCLNSSCHFSNSCSRLPSSRLFHLYFLIAVKAVFIILSIDSISETRWVFVFLQQRMKNNIKKFYRYNYLQLKVLIILYKIKF